VREIGSDPFADITSIGDCCITLSSRHSVEVFHCARNICTVQQDTAGRGIWIHITLSPLQDIFTADGGVPLRSGNGIEMVLDAGFIEPEEWNGVGLLRGEYIARNSLVFIAKIPPCIYIVVHISGAEVIGVGAAVRPEQRDILVVQVARVSIFLMTAEEAWAANANGRTAAREEARRMLV